MVNLGNEGAAYFRASLRGLNGLAFLVSGLIGTGTYYSTLLGREGALDFETGGVSSREDSLSLLNNFSNAMSENSGIAILQDIWADPKDFKEHGNVTLDAEGAVYYVESRHSKNLSMEEFLRNTTSFKEFVVWMRPDGFFVCGNKIEFIYPVDNFVLAVAIGAYDQEGFVIWKPDPVGFSKV